MHLSRWFAALLAVSMLAACTRVTPDGGNAPYAPYPLGSDGEYPRERGGDGGAGM